MQSNNFVIVSALLLCSGREGREGREGERSGLPASVSGYSLAKSVSNYSIKSGQRERERLKGICKYKINLLCVVLTVRPAFSN